LTSACAVAAAAAVRMDSSARDDSAFLKSRASRWVSCLKARQLRAHAVRLRARALRERLEPLHLRRAQVLLVFQLGPVQVGDARGLDGGELGGVFFFSRAFLRRAPHLRLERRDHPRKVRARRRRGRFASDFELLGETLELGAQSPRLLALGARALGGFPELVLEAGDAPRRIRAGGGFVHPRVRRRPRRLQRALQGLALVRRAALDALELLGDGQKLLRGLVLRERQIAAATLQVAPRARQLLLHVASALALGAHLLVERARARLGSLQRGLEVRDASIGSQKRAARVGLCGAVLRAEGGYFARVLFVSLSYRVAKSVELVHGRVSTPRVALHGVVHRAPLLGVRGETRHLRALPRVARAQSIELRSQTLALLGQFPPH
jgi:hypothetical protein